jgi:predicted PurR-regulated permease PerM
MTIHSDAAFLGILVFVIIVATLSVTSRLKQIVGEIQNTNDALSNIEDELKDQRNLIAKLR